MGDTYQDDIHETLDRFSTTVPGFAERIADGRPLRLAVVKMLAAAYDLPSRDTDLLVSEWLEGDGSADPRSPSNPRRGCPIASMNWQRS